MFNDKFFSIFSIRSPCAKSISTRTDLSTSNFDWRTCYPILRQLPVTSLLGLYAFSLGTSIYYVKTFRGEGVCKNTNFTYRFGLHKWGCGRISLISVRGKLTKVTISKIWIHSLGTSINDVPRFLAIFDLATFLFLLYNVRFGGISWTPLLTLISDVINGRFPYFMYLNL